MPQPGRSSTGMATRPELYQRPFLATASAEVTLRIYFHGPRRDFGRTWENIMHVLRQLVCRA
jgi:hypothetical protein